MADITPVTIDDTGYNLSNNQVAAAAGGDKIIFDPNVILIFDNQDASSTTVTIENAQPSNYGEDNDRAVAIPAGERVAIHLQSFRYQIKDGGADDGKVSLTYSSVTSLTLVALRHGA